MKLLQSIVKPLNLEAINNSSGAGGKERAVKLSQLREERVCVCVCVCVSVWFARWVGEYRMRGLNVVETQSMGSRLG